MERPLKIGVIFHRMILFHLYQLIKAKAKTLHPKFLIKLKSTSFEVFQQKMGQ